MNYNKLKYFYEIAKIQNLSRAADILFISQSSLSKAIADLESDFGTELFTRTNRRLILTNAGKELQRQLDSFFSKENEIYHSVRLAGLPHEETISANLKVGFMASKTAFLLPNFIQEFSKRYPGIAVSSLRYNKNELFKRLEKQTLDIAFLVFSMEELSSDLSYEILSEHHLSIIAREDHPLAKRSSLTLAELKNERFIMHGHSHNSNEYAYAITWCRQCGFFPKIVGEYDYVETVLLLIQSGNGISLLSDIAPIHGMKGLVSIPLENAPFVYNGIFWNSTQNAAASELFVSEFKKEFSTSAL